MHIDDAHDDNLVAKETALHAHTRAQTQTADAAKFLDDPIILTTSSDDQTKKSIEEIAPPLPRAKNCPAAAARLRFSTNFKHSPTWYLFLSSSTSFDQENNPQNGNSRVRL